GRELQGRADAGVTADRLVRRARDRLAAEEDIVGIAERRVGGGVVGDDEIAARRGPADLIGAIDGERRLHVARRRPGDAAAGPVQVDRRRRDRHQPDRVGDDVAVGGVAQHYLQRAAADLHGGQGLERVAGDDVPGRGQALVDERRLQQRGAVVDAVWGVV